MKHAVGFSIVAILLSGCSVEEGRRPMPKEAAEVAAREAGTAVPSAMIPSAEETAPVEFISKGFRYRFAVAGKEVFRIDFEPCSEESAIAERESTTLSAGTTQLVGDPASGSLQLRFKDKPNAKALWSGRVGAVEATGRAQVPGLEIVWDADPDEILWGLGERFDGLNQNGRKVDMWIVDAPGQGEGGKDSYYVTPVLYSSAGYALFAADNPEAVFDLNSSGDGAHRYRRVGRRVTFYLAAGDRVKDLVQERAAVQGPYRGVPDWAWGPWISRNSFESQAEAEEAIHGMLERDIPVTAIVQEAWKGSSDSGDFNNFARDRWPEVEKYLAFCAEQGIHNILWQVPILHPDSPHYQTGKEKGFFVKKPDGTISHREHWLAGFANVDFTNPDAVAFWQDLLRPVVRMGTYGFKADDGEDIKPDDVFSDGRRGWEVHNEYSSLYNKALTELLEQEGVPGMLWCRSGSLGIEGGPALWAGDQFASWEQVASLLPAGLSASISGMPFWGHDIGGYIGDPSPELYMRWVQLGAFSPLMQYHGIARREPWEFGEAAEKAYTFLAHLRMNLGPTLKALGQEAARTGLPIMRPMLLEFPDDPRFRNEETQYMLGSNLLVAPVLEEGAPGRVVKFPAGVWHHLIHPVAFEGPADREVVIDLQDAPVFVRQGAALDVQLDEQASLGEWRKGASMRRIAFDPTRLYARNLSVPGTASVLSRKASVYFEAMPALTEGVAVAWHFDGTSVEGSTPMAREGNRLSAELDLPDAVAVAGAQQRFSIRTADGDGKRVELYRGVIHWQSPLTLAARLEGSHYVRADEKTFVTTIKNRSSRPVDARIEGRGEAWARFLSEPQAVHLAPGATTDIRWPVTVVDTPDAGDAGVTFTLSAGQTRLARERIVLSRALHWAVAGPFPTPPRMGYRMTFPPEWVQEPGVNFATSFGSARWWALDADHMVRNDGVSFVEAFGKRDQAVAYAMAKLQSTSAQDVELHFGSDDTLTVWLNGDKLYSVETYRAAAPDQEVVPARLRAGENLLVVKVAQDKAGWQLHFHVTGPNGVRASGVQDGFTDIDRYRPDRPVLGEVLDTPQPLPWLLAGPFPFDRTASWPGGAHDEMAGSAHWPPTAEGLHWQPATVAPDGVVDLNQAFDSPTYCDAYAASAIRVARPTRAKFTVGSDDGITVWLNGRQVLNVQEWRGFEYDSDQFEAQLKPGLNHLLCRIRQGSGDWLFRVEGRDLTSSPPRVLTGVPMEGSVGSP